MLLCKLVAVLLQWCRRLVKQREQDNPNQHREDEEQGNNEAKEQQQPDEDVSAVISEEETDSQGSEPRRSARESRPVSRLRT
jgi:mannitol-1-phosphate/altronate dehydrogenase